MAEFIWKEEGLSNNSSFIAMHLYLTMIISFSPKLIHFTFVVKGPLHSPKIEPFFIIIIKNK